VGQVRMSDGFMASAVAASRRVKVEAFQEGLERTTYLNQSWRVGRWGVSRGLVLEKRWRRTVRLAGKKYLGIAEWLSGVEFDDGHDLAAGLHGGVDEIAVLAVERTENLLDHLNLDSS
jgi:hypothetical protein